MHQELLRLNYWDCISVVSQTPADVAAIVCFWYGHVHKCICNGVSVSLSLMRVFGLCASAVIHDCFPCLLTCFLWCCETEHSCQPWGTEASESFNKCLWAWSSQVITSSHRRAHMYTFQDTHTFITPHFEEDRLLSACLTKVAGSSPGGSSHTPTIPLASPITHFCGKKKKLKKS